MNKEILNTTEKIESNEMKIIKCTHYQSQEIEKLKNKNRSSYIIKRLDIIQIGTRADSDAYIKQKITQGKKAGCMVVVHRFSFPDETNTYEKINNIKRLISDLNTNGCVHGIMIQLPIDDIRITKDLERELIDSIDPLKDVDCLTTTNLGKLYSGYPLFIPCTPAGIIEIFNNLNFLMDEEETGKYKNYLEGKRVLIIGRSHIVGKPLSMLLTDKNATVTLAHTYTPNLKEKLWDYDIIITAAGKKDLIDRNDFLRLNSLVNVRPKAIIDVAINRDDEGLCGDVCRELYTNTELQKNIEFATATPGGVGRMTVLSLIRNIYKASHIQESNNKY